jgi:hypothetical protein
MALVEATRHAERSMRLSVLARTVAAGNYRVPAEYVADAILSGRTRPGEGTE